MGLALLFAVQVGLPLARRRQQEASRRTSTSRDDDRELSGLIDKGLAIQAELDRLAIPTMAAYRATFWAGGEPSRIRDWLRGAQSRVQRSDADLGNPSLLRGVNSFESARSAVAQTLEALQAVASRQRGR